MDCAFCELINADLKRFYRETENGRHREGRPAGEDGRL